MERPHGICMLLSRRQGYDGSSIRNFFCFKPDEACDWNIVRMPENHKALFHAQVAGVALSIRKTS